MAVMFSSPTNTWTPDLPGKTAASTGQTIDYSGGVTSYPTTGGSVVMDDQGRYWYMSSDPRYGYALIAQGYGPGETPPGTSDQTPPPAAGPPPSGGDGGGGGGFGDIPAGSLTERYGGTFTPPPPVNLGGPAGIPYVPQTPVFSHPQYTPPPAFNFPQFNLPNWEEVLQDPGYVFRLGQGKQALEQSAAARGVLNSGGTLGDVLKFGQDYATQEYGNVFQRDLQKYLTNRDTALQTYGTNYGSQYMDPYKLNYQAAQDEFAPQMTAYQTQAQAGQRQNELDYSNAWQRYLQDYNQFRNWQNDTWDKVSFAAGA